MIELILSMPDEDLQLIPKEIRSQFLKEMHDGQIPEELAKKVKAKLKL